MNKTLYGNDCIFVNITTIGWRSLVHVVIMTLLNTIVRHEATMRKLRISSAFVWMLRSVLPVRMCANIPVYVMCAVLCVTTWIQYGAKAIEHKFVIKYKFCAEIFNRFPIIYLLLFFSCQWKYSVRPQDAGIFQWMRRSCICFAMKK